VCKIGLKSFWFLCAIENLRCIHVGPKIYVFKRIHMYVGVKDKKKEISGENVPKVCHPFSRRRRRRADRFCVVKMFFIFFFFHFFCEKSFFLPSTTSIKNPAQRINENLETRSTEMVDTIKSTSANLFLPNIANSIGVPGYMYNGNSIYILPTFTYVHTRTSKVCIYLNCLCNCMFFCMWIKTAILYLFP
jgi:hypothetical protein